MSPIRMIRPSFSSLISFLTSLRSCWSLRSLKTFSNFSVSFLYSSRWNNSSRPYKLKRSLQAMLDKQGHDQRCIRLTLVLRLQSSQRD